MARVKMMASKPAVPSQPPSRHPHAKTTPAVYHSYYGQNIPPGTVMPCIDPRFAVPKPRNWAVEVEALIAECRAQNQTPPEDLARLEAQLRELATDIEKQRFAIQGYDAAIQTKAAAAVSCALTPFTAPHSVPPPAGAPSVVVPTAAAAPTERSSYSHRFADLSRRARGTVHFISLATPVPLPPGGKKVSLAAFDMDYTLIRPLGTHLHAQDARDWQWLHPSAVDRLKALSRTHMILLISNQTDESKLDTMREKIGLLEKAVGMPLPTALCYGGEHRKPSTQVLQKVFGAAWRQVLDHDASFFVGDAAGRPKSFRTLGGQQGDFSCVDRKFAFNAGLRFLTPEEFFLGQAPHSEFSWDGVSPDVLTALESQLKHQPPSTLTYHSSRQEVVVLVGCPGSGKSTFYQMHLWPHGYVHCNRDTQGGAMLQTMREALQSGKSVCVDNTSPGAAERRVFLDVAQEFKIPARIIHVSTSRRLAEHFASARGALGIQETIPGLVFDIFEKKFQPPSLRQGCDAGFDSVTTVNVAQRLRLDYLDQLTAQTGKDAREAFFRTLYSS